MAGKAADPTGALPRGTSVRRCLCAHRFQDATYGPGQRLHNARKGGWRCTVCSRESAS